MLHMNCFVEDLPVVAVVDVVDVDDDDDVATLDDVDVLDAAVLVAAYKCSFYSTINSILEYRINF